MARLYRPHIPLEARLRVVLRQLGEMWPNEIISRWKAARSFSPALNQMLIELAALLNCEVKDLRLDHDPPLGTRPKTGDGKKTRYTPDANDEEHLFYRPHGAEFERSHDVKTRIRGDHGQFSDLALIKRERKRVAKRAKQQSPKIRAKHQRWFSRPLRSGNQWPPKGARKFGSKR